MFSLHYNGDLFSNNRVIGLAQIIFILNLIAITKAFALVGLFETLLVLFFLLYKPLRVDFIKTISDIRVILLFIFWFWTFVTGFWSISGYENWIEEVWSWRKLLLFPIGLVLFKNRNLKNFSLWVFVCVCFFYLVWSNLIHLDLLQFERAPAQVLENHTVQSLFFSYSALISSMFAQNSKSRYLKFLLFAMALFFLHNVLLLNTGKAGIISCFVIIFWWILFKNNLRKIGVVILVSGLIALSFSSTAQNRFEMAYHEVSGFLDGSLSERSAMGYRLEFWVNSFNLVREKGFFGAGAGGFKDAYIEIRRDKEWGSWRAEWTDDPHQQYLLIAAEHGIIGLGIFLLLLFFIFRSIDFEDEYHFIFSFIFVVTFLGSFFNGHFNSFVEGRFFWLMAGILLAGRVTRFKEVVEWKK